MMAYSETVYVEKLTEFSNLLRQNGLSAGPGETANALRLLETMELTERNAVRDGLRAVYAKSRQEQYAFDKAFDGFFVSVEQREAYLAKHRAEAEEMARRRAQAATSRQH